MRQEKSLGIFQSVEFCNLYNYQQLCLHHLSRFWAKEIIELGLGSGGRFKHEEKSYEKILGIGIPDLLTNLMSCHGFLKNKDSVVILKFPNRMFEYYFSKVFTYFDCNKINFEKLPSEVKDRIYAELTDNSDKVMICSTTIISTSKTLKNFLVNTSFHSSYIQK